MTKRARGPLCFHTETKLEVWLKVTPPPPPLKWVASAADFLLLILRLSPQTEALSLLFSVYSLRETKKI